MTVSHEHGDHNYVTGISGNPEVVKGTGKHEAKGIIFQRLPTYHDKVQGGERGPNTIFCFTLDGMKVAHLGDLGHMPGDEVIAELKDVDILLIPIGGPAATFDLPEAEELCERIKPRVIIPMHFKNDKCSFPKYTVDDFTRGKNNVKRVGSSEVELTKDALPPTTEILVVEHAL